MTAAQLAAHTQDSPLRWPAPVRDLRGTGIKAAITCALLALLALNLDLASFTGRLSALDGRALALAGLLLVAQYALACGRWFFILRQLKLPIDGRQAVSIYGVGALANMLLVSIAGLSARSMLLMRGGADFTRAAAALAAERIAALAGLVLCFALALAPGYALVRPLLDTADITELFIPMAALAIMALGGAFVLLRFAPARRFAHDLRLVFASGYATFLLMLVSTAIIYLGFAGVAALAIGMGIDIALTELLTVLPLVAFAAALPVSLGGWGVREGAMMGSLALFHVPADAAFALSVSYGLLGVAVVSLLGGVSALLGLPGEVRDTCGFRQDPACLPTAKPTRD